MDHFSRLEIVLITLWPVFVVLFLCCILAIYCCFLCYLEHQYPREREGNLENGPVEEERREAVFIDDELYFSTSSDSGGSDEDVECSICLRPIKIKRTIEDLNYAKIVPCGHKFHRLCVESWENRGNSDCPNCRSSFYIVGNFN